jgi:hypothetical protein
MMTIIITKVEQDLTFQVYFKKIGSAKSAHIENIIIIYIYIINKYNNIITIINITMKENLKALILVAISITFMYLLPRFFITIQLMFVLLIFLRSPKLLDNLYQGIKRLFN